MSEQTDQSQSSKVSRRQILAILAIFAAVPIIGYISVVHGNHFWYGAVASMLLAWGAIELQKMDKTDEEEGQGEDS